MAQFWTLGDFDTFMKNRTLTKFLVIATILVGACSVWSQSLAIEPGIAVGSVHSGMTMQQVIAKLGQPDQTNDSVLVYSHLGLQVTSGNGEIRSEEHTSELQSR